MPQTARRTGLTQMALPYAQDPGITRHLAAFLTRQARALAASHDAPVKVVGVEAVEAGVASRSTSLQQTSQLMSCDHL